MTRPPSRRRTPKRQRTGMFPWTGRGWRNSRTPRLSYRICFAGNGSCRRRRSRRRHLVVRTATTKKRRRRSCVESRCNCTCACAERTASLGCGRSFLKPRRKDWTSVLFCLHGVVAERHLAYFGMEGSVRCVPEAISKGASRRIHDGQSGVRAHVQQVPHGRIGS
jgi:hypothetical protein